MLYGKGGLAIAEEQHSAAVTQNIAAISIDVSGKAVHTGVVVGAGGEYAFAPNWSVKAEYDYIKMFAQHGPAHRPRRRVAPFGAGMTAVMTAGVHGPAPREISA